MSTETWLKSPAKRVTYEERAGSVEHVVTDSATYRYEQVEETGFLESEVPLTAGIKTHDA